MNILKKMYTLILDGVRHAVDSNKIAFRDDKVYAGDKMITSGLTGTVHVEFHGGLAQLDCGSAVVTGNITGPVDAGSLEVTGNIEADKVDCGSLSVGGDLHVRKLDCGSVEAKNIYKTKK